MMSFFGGFFCVFGVRFVAMFATYRLLIDASNTSPYCFAIVCLAGSKDDGKSHYI